MPQSDSEGHLRSKFISCCCCSVDVPGMLLVNMSLHALRLITGECCSTEPLILPTGVWEGLKNSHNKRLFCCSQQTCLSEGLCHMNLNAGDKLCSLEKKEDLFLLAPVHHWEDQNQPDCVWGGNLALILTVFIVSCSVSSVEGDRSQQRRRVEPGLGPLLEMGAR